VFHPIIGELTYIAGSTIICYDSKNNKQVKYFLAPFKRHFTALNFSSDGKYLVAACRPSHIVYWDYTTSISYGQKPIKIFKAHKSEIQIVLFSPN